MKRRLVLCREGGGELVAVAEIEGGGVKRTVRGDAKGAVMTFVHKRSRWEYQAEFTRRSYFVGCGISTFCF